MFRLADSTAYTYYIRGVCTRNANDLDFRFQMYECIVKRAHAVASESVISDHVTAPELPEPDAATLSDLRQLFAFPTHSSSSSHRSSRFPHLPPSLSANRTRATYSQDAPLATHQAFSAEETRIAHIGPANDKPEGDTAHRCTRSALPSPTVPRSGPIRKDSE